MTLVTANVLKWYDTKNMKCYNEIEISIRKGKNNLWKQQV